MSYKLALDACKLISYAVLIQQILSYVHAHQTKMLKRKCNKKNVEVFVNEKDFVER